MIDWRKVSELNRDIGPEDFSEVVELFLEEVDEVIAEIGKGVDEEKLEAKLHFLKGSALNLGFDVFSRLCAEGEASAAAGRYDAIDLPKIVACYEQSKQEFAAEVDARLAA